MRLIGAALLLMAAVAPRANDFDLVLSGGRVVDGSGAPWFTADVGVRGDRIAAVGDLGGASAARRVDARGLTVTPGFIDLLGQSEYHVLVDPRAASKVLQGITTEITGEGDSIAPLSDAMVASRMDSYRHYGLVPSWRDLAGYFAAFQKARPAINLGTFVGAGGVRELVVGNDNRGATPAELARMERLVAEAMEQGAFGLSSSLIYVPGSFASTEELVALARVASRHGGSYITHMRNEDDHLDAAFDEVLRIAREARIAADVYHLKTAGQRNWGTMPRLLGRLEAARAEGLDVAANQYPYTASGNELSAALPQWAREGGRDKLVARLKDEATRARIRKALDDEGEWPEKGKRILLTSVLNPAAKSLEGKTLAQIGRERGIDPREALMDVLIEDNANTSRVTFTMHEEDVKSALAHRLVAFCTDSGSRAEDGPLSRERSHPRGWASTARILGKYVRDEKVLPLEEAVRKMTSLPAARVHLVDRGLIRPGMAADLVAFDLARVAERSRFEDPNHYSEGFLYVAVNGKLAVDGGRLTEQRVGRPLYGPGKR